jgi:hypothetical protein
MSHDAGMEIPANTTHSDPLAQARARLDALAALGEDWDSYGAVPIAPLAIRTAFHLMDRVVQHGGRAPYFVGPIPYGGVEIEYRNGNRSIEIDIHPDKKLDILTVLGDGAVAIREARYDVPLSDVFRMIDRILGE